MLLGIAFGAGAILFCLGTYMVVRARNQKVEDGADAASTAMAWTIALGVPGDAPLDVATRIDMVERLAMLGEPWCVAVLQSAALEERDIRVRAVIAATLARIAVTA
jgi:hypothetical protein